MKENIITIQMAKLAKEKGFDLKTQYWYGCDNPASGGKGNVLMCSECRMASELYEEETQQGTLIYAAPTISQLQFWLRVKHNINVYAYVPNESGYWGHSLEQKAKYDSYEDALREGLLMALNLI